MCQLERYRQSEEAYEGSLVLDLLADDFLDVSLLCCVLAFASFGFATGLDLGSEGLLAVAFDSFTGCSFGFGFFFGRPLPPESC